MVFPVAALNRISDMRLEQSNLDVISLGEMPLHARSRICSSIHAIFLSWIRIVCVEARRTTASGGIVMLSGVFDECIASLSRRPAEKPSR